MFKLLKSFPAAFYICLLLSIISLFATYSNHFYNDFHFDDSHTIYNNIYIRDIKNIPLFFQDSRTFSSFPPNQVYRPGITTFAAVNYWISNKLSPSLLPKPFWFHVSIFIIYVLLGFFLFLFLHKILAAAFNHELTKYIALFGTAWFWLHTANAETINYIISCSDTISTFFILASFTVYLYKPEWRKYYIHLLIMAMGFTFKETTLMAVPLIAVYSLLFEKDLTFMNFLKRENRTKSISVLKEVIIPIVFAALIFAIAQALTSKTQFTGGLSRYRYIITQPFVMLHYFKNFFYPNDLSADTDWKELQSMSDIRFVIGMLFLIGITYLTLKLSTKKETKPAAFGIAWFFIALLPTSSIIPFSEVLNDHRVFFPYIGLVLACINIAYVYLLKYYELIFNNTVYKYTLLAACFLLLGVHAYGTYQRNIVWKTELSLWKDVSIKSPGNGRGLMNYGLAIMNDSTITDKTYKYGEAEKLYKKCMELLPYYSNVQINMAMLKIKTNDTAAAEIYFKNAIILGPALPDNHYFYAQYLCGRKRFDEAIPLLKKTLELSSGYVFARYVLLNVYADKYMWDELDKLSAESIALFPNDSEILKFTDVAKNRKSVTQREEEKVQNIKTPQAYIDLSLAYFNEGKYEECVKACFEVLKLDSTNADAYNNISCCYNQMGMWDESVEYADKAIKYRPNFEVAIRNRKNIYERNQSVYQSEKIANANPSVQNYLAVSTQFFNGLRYKDCIKYAELALKLDPNSADAYNNLCAANSKLKNWDIAMQFCNKSLKLRPNFEATLQNIDYIQKQKAAGQ
jgi:protein O-mannosyl-transferase